MAYGLVLRRTTAYEAILEFLETRYGFVPEKIVFDWEGAFQAAEHVLPQSNLKGMFRYLQILGVFCKIMYRNKRKQFIFLLDISLIKL